MIIDSSVLVDIDRGSEKFKDIPHGRHSISAATMMEISLGANIGAETDLEVFKQNFDIIPVNGEVAEKAGEIAADLRSKGEKVELNDIYIAATAIINGEPILTSNTKHFDKIKGAETVDWNQI